MLGQVYVRRCFRRGETLIFEVRVLKVVLPSRRNVHFRILGHLGLILGDLGDILGNLGAILGHLGAFLGHLGVILGHLGVILGRLGVILVSLLGGLGSKNGALVDAKRSF